MSAGIEEFDKGVVYGTTWHNLPQYIQQPYPVQPNQVREVFDFGLEKKQLSLVDETLGVIPVEAWAIQRTDNRAVLVPAIGSRFHVISHNEMFESINEGLLSMYQDLDIESVGTLRNGATCFVNLKVADVAVKGDKSPNMCRMMFSNPLGQGCYTVGVHNVRIVCQNTLDMAEAQAAAQDSLHKIRHTSGAEQKINDTLVDMARVKMGLEAFRGHMNWLVDQSATTSRIQEFMDSYIPIPEDMEGRGRTTRQNKRDRILTKFEEDQALDSGTDRSLYALLQAVTYCVDHLPAGSRKDPFQVQWDGLTGTRAEEKVKALNIIDALAA